MLSKLSRKDIPLDLKRINQAVVENDINYIKTLISLIDVNSKLGPNELTLSELAVEENKADIVNFLVQNKADVNVFNKYWGTPLMRALYNKNIVMVQLLISSGAEINFIAGQLKGRMLPERYAGSALHIAAKEGLLELARILLENKADLNARKIPNQHSKCLTPLDLSIDNNKKDLFDLFIEHKDKINLDVLENALVVALGSWEEYYVLKLLPILEDRNCNPAVVTNAKFVLAVVHNNLAEAKELIQSLSIDVNKLKFGDWQLTQYAAKHDNLDMLKLLILFGAYKNGKELNHDLDSPLETSAVYNSLSVMTFLLKSPHRLGELNEALNQAVLAGHFNCVKLLVEAGADIDHKPCDESFLTLSIQRGYTDITGYLLSKNAKLALGNHKGKFSSQTTPFHAALKNNMELAVLLIMRDKNLLHIPDRGSSIKPIPIWIYENLSREKNEKTLSIILAFAILAEDVESVSLLIWRGVDMHAAIYNEMSPYQLSQKSANSSIKEALANTYPDRDEKNNSGFFKNVSETQQAIIASEYTDPIELEQKSSEGP